MKACKITFSLELLLNQLGLDHPDQLVPYNAGVNAERGTVTIYLTGDHPDLPEGRAGQDVPEAKIIGKRIESRIKVSPRS